MAKRRGRVGERVGKKRRIVEKGTAKINNEQPPFYCLRAVVTSVSIVVVCVRLENIYFALEMRNVHDSG